jgi:hypothetical protein
MKLSEPNLNYYSVWISDLPTVTVAFVQLCTICCPQESAQMKMAIFYGIPDFEFFERSALSHL